MNDDVLLDLDGQVIDLPGGFSAKFVVTRVPSSRSRPHGLKYSLTLHGPDLKRVVGFDNAHPVGKSDGNDHRHYGRKVEPYVYVDAATLLQHFWADVDRYLASRGVS